MIYAYYLILFCCSSMLYSQHTGSNLEEYNLLGKVKKMEIINSESEPDGLFAVEYFKFNKFGQLTSTGFESIKGEQGKGIQYQYLNTESLKLVHVEEDFVLSIMGDDFDEVYYEFTLLESNCSYDSQDNLIEYSYPSEPGNNDFSKATNFYKNTYNEKKQLIEVLKSFTKDSATVIGEKINFAYFDTNQLKSEKTTSPDGNSFTTLFNKQGREVKYLNSNSSVTNINYDDKGRILTITTIDSLGNKISNENFNYDENGKEILYSYENENFKNIRKIEFTYYENGNVKSKKNTNSNWSFESGGFGDTETTFYDMEGMATKAKKTSIEINGNGEIEKETSKEVTPEIFEYDEHGNWINNNRGITRRIEYYN